MSGAHKAILEKHSDVVPHLDNKKNVFFAIQRSILSREMLHLPVLFFSFLLTSH